MPERRAARSDGFNESIARIDASIARGREILDRLPDPTRKLKPRPQLRLIKGGRDDA
jgi:hypothetical protein